MILPFSHPFVGYKKGRFHSIYRDIFTSNLLELRKLPMDEILDENEPDKTMQSISV